MVVVDVAVDGGVVVVSSAIFTKSAFSCNTRCVGVEEVRAGEVSVAVVIVGVVRVGDEAANADPLSFFFLL